jgi:hypothetical protein
MYAHARLYHTTQRVKYTWDDSVSGYSKLQFNNEEKSVSEPEKYPMTLMCNNYTAHNGFQQIKVIKPHLRN